MGTAKNSPNAGKQTRSRQARNAEKQVMRARGKYVRVEDAWRRIRENDELGSPETRPYYELRR